MFSTELIRINEVREILGGILHGFLVTINIHPPPHEFAELIVLGGSAQCQNLRYPTVGGYADFGEVRCAFDSW